MSDAATIGRQLFGARVRHFRDTLLERALRTRQNALVGAGILGVVLLPFIMIVFVPANAILKADGLWPTAGAALLLHLGSWGLIMLQGEALACRPAERLLNSWPVPATTRRRVDVGVVCLANHVVWVVTLPPLGWHLFSRQFSTEAWIDGLRLLALLALTIGVQYRWLRARSRPPGEARWIRIDRLRERLRGLLMAQPWIGLHLLLLAQPSARGQLWRILAAIAGVSASGAILALVGHRYALMVLLGLMFAIMYVVNGLYYFFRESHLPSRPLLDSWGIGEAFLRRVNLAAFIAADIVLIAALFVSAQAGSELTAPQYAFAMVCAVAYAPVFFLVSIKSADNVLAWSMLAAFPAWLAALMISNA